MRCRQCGTRIPYVRTLMGNATCPRCGWTYRRRPASVQREPEPEDDPQRDVSAYAPPDVDSDYDYEADYDADYEADAVDNRLGSLPGDRRIWIFGGGALALILIAALLLLLVRPGSRKVVDAAGSADATAVVEIEETPDPDAEWVAQAEENLPVVEEYANGILADFQTDLETLVDYTPTEHDIYYVTTPDIILTDFSRRGIVEAIQKIGENESKAGKTYSIGWRAAFRDVGGSQTCLAAFGSGFTGYTFTMNGKQYQYDSLEGMS